MSPLVSDSHRRELFPVTREWVYLNHSWRGPVCAPSAKEARDYIDQLSRDGVEPFEQWRERYFEERARFAVFIGAEPGEIAFTANATDAFARVTLGLDWAPGDHVVAPAADYPGVTRPLLDLRRRGVEVTLVPPREDGSMPAEDLLAATTVRTRLVAASHVDFRTGYRLDVKALCSGCRARGVLSLIDAVQSVGCLDLDVKTIGCDFATFAARKWLLGLDTLGLLYVSSARLNDLTPHVLGTYSVERPLDFDDFEQPLAEDARRFQPGLVPAAQIFALGAA
ncbi:MAG: aminotransferase class V-fold PLP-dependent enzyme, partial [Nitrospira sp.]|nr:aminotransferase class V-fold PLP-dependent enzyme [Nitrospira sp.]